MDEITLDPAVESRIDAFEQALAANPNSRLEDFIPQRNDPKFANIVVELVRIDIELSWANGRRRSLPDYEGLLPELRADRLMRAQVAYEEFRQRKLHGEQVSLDDLAAKYDVAATDWSTVVAPGDETKTSPHDFAVHSDDLPSVGERWREFEVIEELGRGALSRVYLARQQSLSGRLIVLKFAPKHLLEAEKLAKLQHQNIVPVFSVDEDRHFHVFCMPYLGTLTLAEFLTRKTQEGAAFSEQETLDLAVQLADALAHAHEKGIVHNDMKPANVLISDDGQPMLLDFNLAADRMSSGEISSVGGTLPYMSPESLIGFAAGHTISDARSDIYSLGVVLHELLTGRPPFPDTDTVRIAVERRRDVPRLQPSRVTPGLASVIDKCLAFDLDDRYQTAAELADDLRRHKQHRLLRYAPNTSLRERSTKWCRRHPRLTSFSSFVLVATVVLALAASAWFAREQHVNRLEAATRKAEFLSSYEEMISRLSAIGVDVVDPEAAIAESERLLQEYVPDSDWKDLPRFQPLELSSQQELRTAISKLSFLMANGHLWLGRKANVGNDHLSAAKRWNEVSRSVISTTHKSHLYQLARIHEIGGNPQAAELRRQAKAAEAVDADDLQLFGVLARFDGDAESAIESLERACEQAPRDFSKWFDLACAYADASAWRKAESTLTACLALQPSSMLATYCRGVARQELGEAMDAAADYSRFLKSSPDHPYGLMNRAIAYKSVGKFESALADLDAAIDHGFSGTRALIIRSRVHRELGDQRRAMEDLRAAFASSPKDELDWISQGVARMSRSPGQALEDFQNALTLNPRSHAARRNMAHVLSESLHRSEEAIAVLDSVIDDCPDDPAAYAGRGVLLARAGEFDKALADAHRTIELKGGPRTVLQAACIYALASKERKDLAEIAIGLLGAAFKADPELAKLAKTDPDLRPIHSLPSFAEVSEIAEKIAGVPAAEVVLHNAPRPTP